jgi:tRNA A37 threonylcarbamoyltransferase TsaD
MIALAGYYRLAAGETQPPVISARPRWPLKDLAELQQSRGK